MKIRKILHPVLIKLIACNRKFELCVDGKIPDGQFIFIANHYGINDIPTAGEIIKKHTYVLVINEDENTLDGLFLKLNGVIWTSRIDKEIRKKSREEILRHLKMGHNILMYPEATWNNSPNLLMLPMNYGCVALSLEANIPIIPIYLFFTDDKCYAKIHKPFYPSPDKEKSIQKLRDIMATTAFEFEEKFQKSKRNEIQKNYWKDTVRSKFIAYRRTRKDPDKGKRYEEQFIFKPKNIVENADAFAHLNYLTPNIRNAFLFNKRLK